MPTLGETVRALEERLVVDRQPELARFRRGLTDASARPEILNVTDRGGNSVLLGAFRHAAELARRAILRVDGRTVHATREDFPGVLGGGTLEEILARQNAARALLLADSFEELAGLSRFLLDALLARLDIRAWVVVGGRWSPLPRWPDDDTRHRLVRPLILVRLPAASTRAHFAWFALANCMRLLGEILATTRRHPVGQSSGRVSMWFREG
jgi:hypothetical protein